jgi:hypothetical protein
MALVTAWKKVTIAVGESLSDALDITGMEVCTLQQADDCEGEVFTFQGSLDGETYADVQTDSAELSITKSDTDAQSFLLPEAKRLRGFVSIKVRSGTSTLPTVQTTADAVIWVGLRELGPAC